MEDKKYKIALLSAAMALQLTSVTINAQVSIKDEQRFIVTFKQSSDLQLGNHINTLFDTTAAKLDAEIITRLPDVNAMAVVLNSSQKKALENDTSVKSIEVDPKRFLLAESTPYGIKMVQANQLSDAGSSNQKVCIVDTGYDLDHEDLISSGVTGNDGYGSNNTGNWYNDGNGHGTHVAGTIAAIGGNNHGVVGVNPSGNLGLHIVKVFNDSGEWAYGSDLIKAISQCKTAGANIISMSLGGSNSSSAEQAAFDNAYASGVLNIAAAGNSGNSNTSYPASYNSVVSVAAVDSSGNVASFSQYNSQVEIAAPGVSVRSTYNNGGYKSLSGTSMATPHVAGVAALVWGNNPDCSVQQIRDGLNTTAEDKGGQGRDNYYGYGIVKAKNADAHLKNVCGNPTNKAPVANFSSTTNGLTASFSDGSSDDNAVTSHSWSFGDGSTSSSKNPSHTYTAKGTYTVKLTVSDAQGLTDNHSIQLTVPKGDTGDCAIAWSATAHYQIGDIVTFEGYEYESTWWSTGASPAIYSNVWKKLTACDNGGDPDENKAPVSSFTFTVNQLLVSFNNTATDDKKITSYSWSFGDGSSSTSPNPSHNFEVDGTYVVSLTVYDAEGLHNTSSKSISVKDDGNNQGCDGLTAWSASTSYAIKDKVSYNGKKYEAIWWSTGASPDIFSNVWKNIGSCQ